MLIEEGFIAAASRKELHRRWPMVQESLRLLRNCFPNVSFAARLKVFGNEGGLVRTDRPNGCGVVSSFDRSVLRHGLPRASRKESHRPLYRPVLATTVAADTRNRSTPDSLLRALKTLRARITASHYRRNRGEAIKDHLSRRYGKSCFSPEPTGTLVGSEGGSAEGTRIDEALISAI